MCQLLIFCFSDPNALFFVLFLTLDSMSISTLSVGLILAFVNREFWRDTARPLEIETSFPGSSELVFDHMRRAGSAHFSSPHGPAMTCILSIFLFPPSRLLPLSSYNQAVPYSKFFHHLAGHSCRPDSAHLHSLASFSAIYWASPMNQLWSATSSKFLHHLQASCSCGSQILSKKV